jgi:hypothetical protein
MRMKSKSKCMIEKNLFFRIVNVFLQKIEIFCISFPGYSTKFTIKYLPDQMHVRL